MSFSLPITDFGRLATGGRHRVKRFWAWWTAEISGAMPAGFRRLIGKAESRLLVAQQNDRVTVLVVGPDGRHPVAEFDRDAVTDADLSAVRSSVDALRGSFRQVLLELPRGRVLRRRVRLPSGTEERLGQVLGFEMDRFTPFRRDQVYFDYRVCNREPSGGSIEVDLTLTLRSYLDPLLEQLDACGISPGAVRVAEKFARPEADANRADLLPESRRPRTSLRDRALKWALVALAVALGTSVLALPVLRQGAALEDLRAQVRAIEHDAVSAARLRDEISAVADRENFFLARRQTAPSMVQLLDELTRVVPDDTWVSRLEVLDRQVRIHGESEGATSLIALVEASGLLQNARFASPVTKNPRTGNDRFVIEADLALTGGIAP